MRLILSPDHNPHRLVRFDDSRRHDVNSTGRELDDLDRCAIQDRGCAQSHLEAPSAARGLTPEKARHAGEGLLGRRAGHEGCPFFREHSNLEMIQLRARPEVSHERSPACRSGEDLFENNQLSVVSSDDLGRMFCVGVGNGDETGWIGGRLAPSGHEVLGGDAYGAGGIGSLTYGVRSDAGRQEDSVSVWLRLKQGWPHADGR